ncbi:MAG TPA: pyridoxal-dependent decarboxylase [Candidatus Dormibacteraeota bacterium]|nr:pyridoxal-dependent decarboxylase [Candidatus Dormibacteraeota bacterium]
MPEERTRIDEARERAAGSGPKSEGGDGAPGRPDPLAPFRWHPEPELLAVHADTARDALTAAGRAAWDSAVAYVLDEGLRRGMGEPAGYEELRTLYFGPGGGPRPAPDGPTPFRELLDEFRTRLAPHMLNAWHPATLSYFTPPPLVASVAGELLAQVTQQGVDIWHAGPVAAFVEEEVVRWLCDLVGYGAGSFGLLASGGTMANFIGLALARESRLPRLRSDGRPPRGAALEGVRVYASDQTHFSVRRALDELGFPPGTLRVVAADDRFRLRGAPVAQAIAEDRSQGLLPLAISAVAGSTNTGSVDAIDELADVAEREGLWLHVDAAYGAAARLSRGAASRVPALERADSVTVDPHKWFFQAYDIGGIVVRDGDELRTVFGSSRPEYYRGGGLERITASAAAGGLEHEADADREADAHGLDFYKLGFEGSRRWRALKLWMSWRHLGTSGLGRLVDMNLAVAAHLASSIAASDDFEALPAAPELSVVCFRHLPGGRARAAGLDPRELDAHQDRLQAALEASGDGWLSTTRLRGATYLRAGVLNYLTTEADIDALLDRLRALAGELEGVTARA